MKLPTKEELWSELCATPDTRQTGPEATLRIVSKYVRLAEEEARREAQPVVAAARLVLRDYREVQGPGFRKREGHAYDIESSAWKSIDELTLALLALDRSKAAPATAEAGRDEAYPQPARIVGSMVRPVPGFDSGHEQPIERDTYNPPACLHGAAKPEDCCVCSKPPAPPPSKAVTEDGWRAVTNRNVAEAFEAIRKLELRIEALDSARSAAGGKTDLTEAKAKIAVIEAARAWRASPPGGVRSTCEERLSEAIWHLDLHVPVESSPAAREGSGA